MSTEAKLGYVSLLERALAWGTEWHDQCPSADSILSERDVTILGLIAQLDGVTRILCLDANLAAALPGPAWLSVEPAGDLAAISPDRSTILVAPLSAMTQSDLIRCAGAGTHVVLYGCSGTLMVPTIGVGLRLLSAVNPALWCSDLALVVPANQQATLSLIGRLAVLLGDQSLDPLSLYEENCRLKRGLRVPAPTGGAERDLIALRRFVRDRIERAAITTRGITARTAPGTVIDWSAAFLMPPELTETATPTPLDEAEVRARRARIEAEFLRAQLKAVTIARDIDHHDLIAGSGLFDLAWYAETYDVPLENAIRHYLDEGHRQGNDPSPLFSTRAYLEASPDVAGHGFCPLLHYLMDGIYEGRVTEPPTTLPESIWQEGFVGA